MAISTHCASCGKAYNLADDQAGQRVRCRVCRAEFDVPGRVETLESVPRTAVSDGAVSPRSELYEPLVPPLPRKSSKWKYVLGGLAAACLLVFLGCTGAGVMTITQLRKELAQRQALADAELEAA